MIKIVVRVAAKMLVAAIEINKALIR